MTRWKLLFVVGLGLAGIAVGALWQTGRPGAPPATTPVAERATLALLTSLPLVFGESFGIESGGSAVLRRLEQTYNVQPIGVADAASLQGKRLLLMAHPRAQPAEALVELDAWVRRGGRVLLLADPRLSWESERPLGDPFRAPPGFADTGLLKHWGLDLAGPVVDGPMQATNGAVSVMAVTPGRLSKRGGPCEILGGGFVARCTIGNGAATIVADADFLNVEGEGAIDGPTETNLDLVAVELARLQSL